MLIPVSNWELDSVPVVTTRVRKGEMCVGRENCTGNMRSRTAVWSWHRAARQSALGDDPWAGAVLASCCPLRACTQQTTAAIAPTPSQPAPVAGSEDLQPGHSAPSTRPPPAKEHRPKITAQKQTWHSCNWVYFQPPELFISLFWALLFLCGFALAMLMAALRSEINSVWACPLSSDALTSHKPLWLLPNLHLYIWAPSQPGTNRASASCLALPIHLALNKKQREIMVSPIRIQTEAFIISSVCSRCLPVGSLHKQQRGGREVHTLTAL